MIGATLSVKISNGVVGGYELDLLIMTIAISLLLSGHERVSIERNILKEKHLQRLITNENIEFDKYIVRFLYSFINIVMIFLEIEGHFPSIIFRIAYIN